ncbi:mitotic checkpoint serine/threonine-protein kinase BUB1 isoform X4 [Hevea brasiliensis]|uniref:mitotic checkpoint serine/threonine-protein kinase BUB1 isoform X4 n=1 Tax=Hevea brasiliensis TaxID=3981 RepID=UPI0025EB586F|nr:mitotic checkpoint serine/threonine-protein kinase BUB1 isoform X4 [Hevea brasiliensis]
MTVMFTESENSSYAHDPLFPWLLSIKKALDNKAFGGDLNKLLLDCIRTFKHNAQYRNDPRFLKIWLLYLEGSDDSEIVFKEMEENKICSDHSLLYELYAGLLEAKENWQQAHMIYRTGILRKAKPLERLKGAHALFLDRMSHRVNGCSVQKIDGDESIGLVKNCVYPWSNSTMEELLKKINPKIIKYDGYHPFHKAYAGKVDLSSLGNASRNKIVKIGGKQYHIKGCAGQGGFAKVFKAFVNSNPDDIVALKIQKPAFPWEFYMYRQLDQRISTKQRSSFGFAHGMDVYSDYSILVCDYLCHGTLHDVINSYFVIGKSMEEVLCIYYTREMLYMLETLHGVGIIHGDFKPDNLLVRYSRETWTLACSLQSLLKCESLGIIRLTSPWTEAFFLTRVFMASPRAYYSIKPTKVCTFKSYAKASHVPKASRVLRAYSISLLFFKIVTSCFIGSIKSLSTLLYTC